MGRSLSCSLPSFNGARVEWVSELDRLVDFAVPVGIRHASSFTAEAASGNDTPVARPLLRYFVSGLVVTEPVEGQVRMTLPPTIAHANRQRHDQHGCHELRQVSEVSAANGELCTDHRGKKLSTMHPERVKEYGSKYKDRAGLYKDGPDQRRT